MLQPIPSIFIGTLSTTQTQFHPIFIDSVSAVENSATSLIASPGTINNIIVNLDVDPGGAASRTFTFRLDGIDQTLTCTINAGSRTARMIGNPISILVGQRISIKSVPTNTPAASAVTFYVEFTPSSGNKSIYGGTWQLSQLSGTRYSFPLRISNNDSTSISAVNVVLQNPVPGAYTAIYARWTALPGAGVGGTLNLVLDGVVQDGSGGTVNTTVNMIAVQSNNATFNLPVGIASELTMRVVMESAGAFLQNLEIGVEFTATNPSQSIIAGVSASLSSNTVATYMAIEKNQNPWNTAESFLYQNIGGYTTFTLSRPRIKLDASPGAGKNRVFLVRKNGANPVGGPSVTVNDTETGDTGTGSVTISDTNTYGWQHTPSGTPTTVNLASWAFLLETTDVPISAQLPFITEVGAISL